MTGGIVRACADDHAAALRHFTSLQFLLIVFDCAERFALRVLKPSQCIIIVCIPLTHAVEQLIRQFLTQTIPK